MKTTLAIIIAALILVCSSVMATDTRVTTMGDNNMILLDDANIFLFPSRLYEHADLAVAEFNHDGMAQFGVHWKFNKDNPWVLGTYFSTESPETPMSYSGTSFGDHLNRPFPANRRINLLYSRKLGVNNFGFGLTYVNSSESPEDPELDYDHSYSRYAFSFGLTPEGGDWDVATGISFGSWTEQFTGTAGGVTTVLESEPDGYRDMFLRGRLIHELNPTLILIPHADFNLGKRTEIVAIATSNGVSYVDAVARGVESKLLSLGAGCGMNYMPVTNVLAVLDLGFSFRNIKEDISNVYLRWDMDGELQESETSTSQWKEKTTIFPYWKLGLEGEVFSWMDVRFGATSNWISSEIETESKTSSASNMTYLGFGFHWNRLHVDVQANPDLFLDGFNFISGESNGMNSRISAVYEMM